MRDPEFVELLKTMAPDAIVVVAFGQILPKSILDLPKYGCVNVHASLLPKYRGAAPIQWAVIDGEKESGVTTMMMDVGLDTGDMLEQKAIPLDEKETGGSLFDKLSALGGSMILSTLKGTGKRNDHENSAGRVRYFLREDAHEGNGTYRLDEGRGVH